MIINCANCEELSNFYFHDSIFTGFEYDYINHKAFFICKNNYINKKQEVVFNNAVFIISQNCTFWGGGNAILGISAVSHPPEFNQCMSRLEDQPDLVNLSRLCAGEQFITLEVLINSGDTLLVTCQSVEITEVPF